MHSCLFFLDKTDLNMHLPHRDIPWKSFALAILVQVKCCDLMISQLEATYFKNVTFQDETDKVDNKMTIKCPKHFMHCTCQILQLKSDLAQRERSGRDGAGSGSCRVAIALSYRPGFRYENALSLH